MKMVKTSRLVSPILCCGLLVGRIVEIRVEGLLAQVKLAIGDQQITSVITSDAVQEMGLERGQTAAALVKSTEVMIVRV